MEKDENKSTQDVKTGMLIAGQNPSNSEEPRQAADDKTKKDADENLDNNDKSAQPGKEHPKEIDDQMQGKKLEEKYRGGGTTDVDEFKQHQDESV